MKKLFFTLLFAVVLSAISARAQKIELEKVIIDKDTRAEHAALHGVIKRVDSDFWDKYYPPNGWGCRCEVIQLTMRGVCGGNKRMSGKD